MPQHNRIDISVDLPGYIQRRIAATLHVPPAEMLRGARAPVAVCLPGGGYNRRYFDLPEPGYSEAEYHVRRGTVIIALDHLGTGDSSVPVPAAALPDVASANAAAIEIILERLKSGSVVEGLAIDPSVVVGIGQSMGGFIAVAMQAKHRCFAALAILGSSMVRTRLPARSAGGELRFSGDAAPAEAAAITLATTDWRYAFHWEDVPEHLAEVDVACKPPTNGKVAPWGSTTLPNIAELVLPGVIAREAAAVDVPVLVAMGERDVCQDPLRELAAFHGTRDLSLFIAPKMAHMHNFAGTREVLWGRLQSFILQAADTVRLRG